MAVGQLYLADKSALARFAYRPVADRLGSLLKEGLVATCPIIDLEVLYSARSLGDYEGVLAERKAMPTFPVTAQTTERAIEVQHQLARTGQHRVPIPDLLIAAVADLNGLIVMHYDADFDRIAQATNQPTTWVVPRGAI